MGKIDVLYHGSPSSKIEFFEPRQIHVRDDTEGRLIFATPSIKVASCFLFTWDDSWVNLTISSQENDKYDFKIFMVISNQNKFKELDKGGSIYLLPIDNFSYVEDKGMGIHEWTNKNKVTPYAEITFSSSLEAMTKLGVKVHFVTTEQFENYVKLSGDEQEAYLISIK